MYVTTQNPCFNVIRYTHLKDGCARLDLNLHTIDRHLNKSRRGRAQTTCCMRVSVVRLSLLIFIHLNKGISLQTAFNVRKQTNREQNEPRRCRVKEPDGTSLIVCEWICNTR